ncbi:hypothetical protein MHU86_8419 [Fragilaria crotonensis]|nr:hypothetical protein MHU86_8419 [Fragilaria crotonensis]
MKLSYLKIPLIDWLTRISSAILKDTVPEQSFPHHMLTHCSSGIDLGRTTHCHSGSSILGIFTHRGIAYISIDDQSHSGRQGDGVKEEENWCGSPVNAMLWDQD